MSTRLRIPATPHLIGAVVTCGALLAIASLVDPLASKAVPVFDPSESGIELTLTDSTTLDGLLLGSLEGRGFTAELIAGTPEASVRVFDLDGTVLFDEIPLAELLLIEGELTGDDAETGDDAWPDAFMDVEVPSDPW